MKNYFLLCSFGKILWKLFNIKSGFQQNGFFCQRRRKGKIKWKLFKSVFWFNAFSFASLFCFAFRLSIKRMKNRTKESQSLWKLSTPDSTPQFSSSAEWKVHLNSIFFVNALLIRHSTIFIPLRFNTCGSPSNWRHKNVIKFQLIFKYVPLRNCFPFRIAFLRLMPLDERFSREKAQARSGKSYGASKMSLKSFFPPSFDSIPCQFQSIRVFHLFADRMRARFANKIRIIEGVNFGPFAEAVERGWDWTGKCNSIGMPFRYFVRRKKISNGETINGSVKSILSFNAVANLHNQLQQKSDSRNNGKIIAAMEKV